MAVFAPLFATQDPYAGNVMARLKPIGTAGHWMGTDETGRDIWARLVYGARMSLISGIAPVTAALLIGGFLGVTAGYMGGLVNTLIMRTMDVFYAFPSILLAIAICGMLGNGLTNAILALSIVFIPPMVRIAETVTPRPETSISSRPRGHPAQPPCRSSATTSCPTCSAPSWSTPPA